MQANVPPMVDQAQFQAGGSAVVQIQYLTSAGQAFSQGDCSDCVPDAVSVSVSNYVFGRLAGYLGLPGITMPPFTTNLPMESAGLDPTLGCTQ
jgi:hypothetical protein